MKGKQIINNWCNDCKNDNYKICYYCMQNTLVYNGIDVPKPDKFIKIGD